MAGKVLHSCWNGVYLKAQCWRLVLFRLYQATGSSFALTMFPVSLVCRWLPADYINTWWHPNWSVNSHKFSPKWSKTNRWMDETKQTKIKWRKDLTCFLDSSHMVSYYLPIHFMALNAILKKIIGGFTWILSFLVKVGTYKKIAHKSVNFHRITPKI